ncbi:pilus assembly protein [Aquabacterium sp. NJ1]|uniref:pilus assembly protein n=1 Tax=Aquabacterium sp. NJ1 TaxID=1538295 RepID=UPI000AED485A|nr:PilC/PilY family type IV pilus protein [Aquabacterium sp. NJ1]
MQHARLNAPAFARSIGCGLVLATLTQYAPAALTDLASAPLETSASTLVKPNILFVLDDSGSMTWDFMPDWANSSTDSLARNSGYNSIYYNPAITYTPPLKYDGTSYASMTSANTTGWTRVPYDGFGVQTPSNFPNTGTTNLFTDAYSGTTQDLTSSAYYYVFIPGEYCTTASQQSCTTQSAPTAAYSVPAKLRWCTDTYLGTCRATRIDTAPTNGSTYTYPRYPGKSYKTSRFGVTTTVPGSNSKVTITAAVDSYPYPGTTAKHSQRADCAGTTCTYAEEMTNFANWWAYYRMRMQMAKSAASIAFATLDSQKRLGYMSINNNTGSDFLNVSDLTSGATGQKAQWYAKLIAARPNNSTPLRTALSTAGRYYAGKLSTVNSVSATDPMQYACQRNYTMLSTDGYWNESNNPKQINGSTDIGDQDSGTAVQRPQFDGTATANTLADVAQYYYSTDLRDSTNGNTTGALGTDVSSNVGLADLQQRMYTSTLGLGASGYMLFQSNYQTAKSGDYYDVAQGTTTSTTTARNGVCTWQTSGNCNWPAVASNKQTTIDDLWHAAVNGHGTYYSAANPSDIRTGLTNFLNDIDTKTASASAATTSNPNVSAGDNFVFKSTFRSKAWDGEMARYTIDISTGKLSAYPSWTESGQIETAAGTKTPGLLDTLDYTTRKIYTYDPTAATPLLPFVWSSMSTTMQSYFKMSAIGSLSQMCGAGTLCLASTSQVDSTTAGTNTGAGGINLVNFLRGDQSNQGDTNATYYREREHILGDIVDSQAVYVKAPLFSYLDSGYTQFRTSLQDTPTQPGRQPMLYVGANDGMLHAFNAVSGVEAWAYIPSMLLPKLYKLADKSYAVNHNYYINATPRQGDVYFDGAWHTILVSGLGAGGRGFFALDITDPSTPKVLWEFTHDTSKGTGYTTDADLGYSYGSPIITKLSDGTWSVMVTSGYNNVSPGNGHGIVWVLNAKTGAIIKKIDTGAGSTSTTAGCSTAPCPAGLAKISAYVESGATNNTALRVYGGDYLGNVWRIDVSGLTASGGTAPVQLLATLADSTGVRQPVTARPEVGKVANQTVVFVGTGSYMGVSDIATTRVQSMYAIKDTLATAGGASGLYGSPRSNSCNDTIKTNCFMQQHMTQSVLGSENVRVASSSTTYPMDFTTMNGWYIDLPLSGERMNTDPDLQLGTLAFTTNIPSTESSCSAGGSSYFNFVDYRTGLAVPGAKTVGVLLHNGSTTALATAPTLVRLPNGKIIGITNLSDGSTITTDTPVSPSSMRTRRLSWRELIGAN